MAKLLYEGKAKILYATDDPDVLVQYYKDDATAFNAQKKGSITNKGILNNQISEVFFQLLESQGIPTHFINRQDDRRMKIRRLRMILLEVVVRNVIAGSLAKRLGKESGQPLPEPVLEYYYKDDALGDPLINEDHIRTLDLATPEQLVQIRDYALRVNKGLKAFLEARGILLVDGKLEFGVDARNQILLADEICPDTCRFWDIKTGRVLDKDRFRQEMGDIEGAYQEVWERIRPG